MIDLDEQTLTAWHEAGHVVGYLTHHRRFQYVTIRPRTPGAVGMVAVRPRRIDRFVQAVIVHMGPMAQGLHALSAYAPGELEDEGSEPDDVITGAYLYGGCDDMATIHEFVRTYGTAGDRCAEQIARTILTDRWADVARLAGALLDRRTLSYSDAVAVLG